MKLQDARTLALLMIILLGVTLAAMYPAVKVWEEHTSSDRVDPVNLFRHWSDLQLLTFAFLVAEVPAEHYDALKTSSLRLTIELNRVTHNEEIISILGLSTRGETLLELPALLWQEIEEKLFPEYEALAGLDGPVGGPALEYLRRKTIRLYDPFGESLVELAEEVSRLYDSEFHALKRIFLMMLLLVGVILVGVLVSLRSLFGFQRLQLGVLVHHPDPLFVLGKDGKILYANPAANLIVKEDSYRKTVEEVVDFVPEATPLANQQMLKVGNGTRPIVHHVDRIYSQRGTFLGEVHFLRDMTQWNQLAAEVRRKRELDLLSTMAASFAHEFNNTLAALAGKIELGLIEEDGALKVKWLGEAKRLIGRASIMTRELIAFGSGESDELKAVTLVEELETAVRIVFEECPLECILDISSIDASFHAADKVGLQVVLTQVLRNAAEAHAASSCNLPVEVSVVPSDGKNDEITILVYDRGRGLPHTDTERLFEPFYTEKWNHKGLGLPFSRYLVERMGGSISLHSRSGGGTTVMIRLPVRYA
jgi:signal transduction histidine kinase